MGHEISFPPMQISLMAWRLLLNQNHTDTQEIDYKLTLNLLETKIPMLSVKDLVDHGIAHISDLYNGPQHKSTKQIMILYQLLNNKLFSCLRITHFLKSHPSPKIKILPKVWQFYSTPKQNLKGISLFYNLICYKLAFKKTTAMGKWETDLGITFSDEQWQHTVRETHKASHCVKHREMMIKMAKGWHYTPYRIASYFPETSPQCWRDCRQIGNLLHMFWQCPNIKKPMEPNIPAYLLPNRNFNPS